MSIFYAEFRFFTKDKRMLLLINKLKRKNNKYLLQTLVNFTHQTDKSSDSCKIKAQIIRVDYCPIVSRHCDSIKEMSLMRPGYNLMHVFSY